MGQVQGARVRAHRAAGPHGHRAETADTDRQGHVLRAEVTALRSAWYFGDDVADAKAFEALRSQQQRDPGFLGVCMAVANAEAGQALAEQADFSLASPMAMPAFLAEAIEQFSAVA